MEVFRLHQKLLDDYAKYTGSFIRISDNRIRSKVEQEIKEGLLWPDPLLQLNPSFEPGSRIDDLVAEGVLHEDCGQIFRIKKDLHDLGKPMRLHWHQDRAIRIAQQDEPYVLTTGTGSGKSLSYIVPIVDYVLKSGSGQGIKAIVVYPMNALANSQREELDKFLNRGFDGRVPLVSFARYTGQESEAERECILNDPPDILLTNYVMLELILTRIRENKLVDHAGKLRFLVFDELHTYRGRQGADVSLLIRRCREAFRSKAMRCVGTSATMASTGTTEQQARVVAEVATKIFGEEVKPENIVGEKLKRSTREYDFQETEAKSALRKSLENNGEFPDEHESFVQNPLASWIEDTFGLIREKDTGYLVRQSPTALKGKDGAAEQLAKLVSIESETCASAIESCLYAGSNVKSPETGFPVFAFRLHQFISRGDTAWASLEPEDARVITLKGQQYVPNDRNKILLPLVFCRHCGQPYYRVDRVVDGENCTIVARDNYSATTEDGVESGYLYLSTQFPWPETLEQTIHRVPEDWLEVYKDDRRIKKNAPVPELMTVASNGSVDPNGYRVAFTKAPFRFCLNPKCGISYNARQRSEVLKLATIGVDGRSTATTILALSTILQLRFDKDLDDEAKKILSFTDNRQDASLQAGHFNDFVEVGLIRSALYRALVRNGDAGVKYDELVHHVEKSLNLPIDMYAGDPELRGPALEETKRALRSMLQYLIYRDLERGWRVTSPNLEQCGLLHFEYLGVDELVNDAEYWTEKSPHAALLAATPEQRRDIIHVLLDHLRRSLAVKEDSLDSIAQERISEQSRQRLKDPWVVEDARDMERANVAWPRAKIDQDRQDDLFISPRGSFGQFLRRPGVLPDLGGPLNLEATGIIIRDLFRCLKPFGIIEEVRDPLKGTSTPGYQLPASIMIWKPGDGSNPMVDRLRVTQVSELEASGNVFFVEFYKHFAELGVGLEGREHTAQVQATVRVEREEQFRDAQLPILFCSPTMELGVDISQLNVVNLRNVPPTPANYAQRSGRAGRSGQPALVYTYCSGFSPHDQYYFQNPTAMVAGTVTAPRLDLVNQDLLRAHVHAIWLSEAGLDLGTTLSEVIEVSEQNLKLPLKDSVTDRLAEAKPKLNTLTRAKSFLASVGESLRQSPWYREDWLDDVLKRLPQSFDEACNRWRDLYRSAVQQRHLQNDIVGDHSRPPKDRERAKRLRAQAEAQINLLVNPQNAMEGDFYSYRYFASEGFLPGYNFPRLPLSAFIPGRRGARGRDEYLSRPRFLAISEFGPRAVVYHEGSMYRINKVSLAYDQESQQLTQASMKICPNCGYAHVLDAAPIDNCQNCSTALHPRTEIRRLVRLQNVSAKRTERITSDEEERQRIGYDIRSTFRFATHAGQTDCRRAEVMEGETVLANLAYGDAVTIWRINSGWKNKKAEGETGFLLDVERGYWATNSDLERMDPDDPMSPNVTWVVPYVQDTRNALVMRFDSVSELKEIATLQSALKQGIQRVFQLEPNELAVDGLPNSDERRLLFFYEASEGGAGVLRRLVEDTEALALVARTALEICHFDPDSGEDLGQDICAAGCHNCLLEYYNQPDHRNIDRQLIRDFLLSLANSKTVMSGSSMSRTDHFAMLLERCDSQLERKWLKLLMDQDLRPPTDAQRLISDCTCRPDFMYSDINTAVFIDGPPHDAEDTKKNDARVNQCLMDAGYLVIRFHHQDDWNSILDQYQDVFGKRVGS